MLAEDKMQISGPEVLSRVKVVEIFWVIVVNVLLFEPALQRIFPYFAYSDEVCCIFLVLTSIIVSLKRESAAGLTTSERLSLAFMMLLVIVGVSSNVSLEIQQQAYPIAIDVLTCTKFFASILAGLIVFRDTSMVLRILNIESKILLSIMSVFAVMNLFVDIGMSYDIRSGIRSFMFVFPHPTALCAALAGMILLLLSNRERNNVWIWIALILVVLSLRSKGIAFAGLMVLFMIVSGKKNLNFATLSLGIAVVLFFGWDQFQYYYGLEGAARLELTRASFAIANTYTPIGSGFATFGSNITANPEFYSILYYRYGLWNVQGLQIDSASFLSDTFWPTILGQFGWLGASLFLGALISLIASLWKRTRVVGMTFLTIALFGYLLISSTSESSFFNPFSVYLSVCFCMSLASRDFSNGSAHASLSTERRYKKVQSC